MTVAIEHTVLLIDGHPIVLDGLRRMLEECGRFAVLQASTAGEGLRLNALHCPDIVIMDLTFADMDGFQVLSRLLQDSPGLLILVFSGGEGAGLASRALKAGVAGYVAKSEDPATLIEGIGQVFRGEIYLGRSTAIGIAMAGISPVDDPKSQLTPREIHFLDLLAQGLNLNEIALELNVSYRTVACVAAAIRQNLGIANMFALVKYAIETNMGRSPGPQRSKTTA